MFDGKEYLLPRRRQFVLDEKTNDLLEELAADRAGNLSYVVRETIQLYARYQDQLDEIEANPVLQQLMRRSAEDIRAGRVVSHGEVKSVLAPRAAGADGRGRLAGKCPLSPDGVV